MMLKKLGIHSITLDLPFRLNHVNCFLAEGDNGMLLIDTGLNDEKTRERWNEELKNIELKDIIITHHYPDHVDAAGYLQNKYHTNINMGKIEEELALTHVNESDVNKLTEYYYKSGVPEVKGREMSENTREFTSVVTPYPKVTNYITEQKEYKIGNEIYKPYVVPGHSDGLITFYRSEEHTSELQSRGHLVC